MRGRNGWTGGQYSLCRALLGVYVIARLFLFQLGAPPAPLLAVLALGQLCALLFALGLADRVTGALTGVGWLLVVAWQTVEHAPGTIGEAAPLVALALHLRIPAAPYGSWSARGRADPGGSWRLPQANLYLLRLLVGLGLGVDLALGTLYPAALASWLVVVPFALDPRWIAPRPGGDEPETVFYDGSCGLCHRAVRMVLAEQPAERAFRLAPLQGPTFEQAVPTAARDERSDSFVVLTSDDKLLQRSDAAVHVALRLGGYWRILGHALAAVPRPLRDAGYDLVAGVRKRLFARPEGLCPVVPPHLAERFLP